LQARIRRLPRPDTIEKIPYVIDGAIALALHDKFGFGKVSARNALPVLRVGEKV
jgi:hypothetical protein